MRPVIEFRCITDGVQPLFACGRCRMLGTAIDRDNDREAAERCCLCAMCGVNAKEDYYTMCHECLVSERERFRSEQRERLDTLPEEEYTGGVVYHDGVFHNDLDSALDVIAEDDKSSAIIHPCREDRVGVPSLAEYVEEHFSDQFDDPDGPYLSPQDEQMLSDVERRISRPTIWIARDDVRLTRSWFPRSDGSRPLHLNPSDDLSSSR